jgi:hypothetical protein
MENEQKSLEKESKTWATKLKRWEREKGEGSRWR